MIEQASAFVERLRQSGILSSREEVAPERRGDRLLAALPGDRLAWFALTPAAAEQLRREDRVLRLITARCTFRVPQPLLAKDVWTVRTRVPGAVDPSGFAARLKAEPACVLPLATFLGTALAQQHTRIFGEDTEGWLPAEPDWPMPRDDIRARLPRVTADAALADRVDRALRTYDRDRRPDPDRSLVHTDLGLHNLAVDSSTGRVNGIFDYGDAAWADRHLDFRYLVFAAVPDALLDATIQAYRQAGGAPIRRESILLCNAVAAASHLADRLGHAAEEAVAGRTLAQDIAWTDWALRRAGF